MTHEMTSSLHPSISLPANAQQMVPLHRQSLGYLFTLSIPLATALPLFLDGEVAGFNLSGWVWVLFLLAGGLVILLELGFAEQFHVAFPWKVWMPWLAILSLSLLWCGGITSRHVQDLCQLTMPLLMGAAASMFVRTEDQLRTFQKMFFVALAMIVLHVLMEKVSGDGEIGGARVLAMTVGLIACVYFAGLPARILIPLVGWIFCMAVNAATGSRTATAVLLLIPLAHPGIRGVLWRAVMSFFVAGLGVLLFHTDTFQHRFFHSGSGTLEDLFAGRFLGFGRFAAWPLILEKAWEHPWFGHGVGASYFFVPTVWPRMTLCHNDYLRVGFECGLIGLTIFLLTVIWQMWDLHTGVRRSSDILKQTFAAAFLGYFVALLISTTDNILIYNVYYMNPLFALMGAAYGVAFARNQLAYHESGIEDRHEEVERSW